MSTASLVTPPAEQHENNFVLAPDVLMVPIQDGRVCLLDMGRKYYALPALGAEMLTRTMEGGIAAAVAPIADRYGVDPQRVHADLTALLSELCDQGLIRPKSARESGFDPGTRLGRLLLRPLLVLIYLIWHSWDARATALLTLAYLSFRLLGWVRTIAVWRACFQPHSNSRTGEERQHLLEAMDEAVRRSASSHFLAVNCKERGLCCWALGRAAGFPAAMVIGINPFPLAGHCWCEADGQILSDDLEHCENFVPVIRYE
jgi:hypothetical protein